MSKAKFTSEYALKNIDCILAMINEKGTITSVDVADEISISRGSACEYISHLRRNKILCLCCQANFSNRGSSLPRYTIGIDNGSDGSDKSIQRTIKKWDKSPPRDPMDVYLFGPSKVKNETESSKA